MLRLFSPLFGIFFGTIAGFFFGIYDMDNVARAPWVGLPLELWPGLDLNFGSTFWKALPTFIVVALIDTAKTIGYGTAIQRNSWREKRAINFQEVQGSVFAMGIGNIFCGLSGIVPNSVRPSSVSMTEITGVASRKVGLMVGVLLILIAFFPKLSVAIAAIPDSVVAAYLIVLLATLFVAGMKSVFYSGMDYRKGVVVGLSFWIGVSAQYGALFPKYISTFAGGIFQSGIISGALLAFLMTIFMALTDGRRHRLKIDLDLTQLPKIKDFLSEFALYNRWNEKMRDRLLAVGEEVFLSYFAHKNRDDPEPSARRILLVARKEGKEAVIEFTAGSIQENIEDFISFLDRQSETLPHEREISLRLLRHFASSVHHEQYYGVDIVTVKIETEG